MKLDAIPTILLATGLTLTACKGTSGPNGAVRFEPPTLEFVQSLNIAAPVTGEQAMAIAAEAAQGTAIDYSQETEKGELLFEVRVDTAKGRMEVEVRASDGAVVEIEPDDGSG